MIRVAPSQAEDLVTLQRLVTSMGAGLVVVGATALRVFVPDLPRYTEDIDVVVAMDLDGLVGLERVLLASGWSRDSIREHRWRGPHRSWMDIIPAGPKLRSARHLTWPRSGMEMSLVGFDHVFERAVESDVGGDKIVRVAAPEVLFLLKVVAYLDDPERREQDLADIHGLLRRYSYGSDRIYSDTVFDAHLSDVEYVPSFLLGTDLAAFCNAEERSVVQRFISTCFDRSSREFTLLLGYESVVAPQEERLALRISAFRQGLNIG